LSVARLEGQLDARSNGLLPEDSDDVPSPFPARAPADEEATPVAPGLER
jgi:hypothetical protein